MKKKTLDWLAKRVCDVLEKNVDKTYADDTRERLAGCNRFQVLVWLNHLDNKNLRDLAHKLGVSFSDLDITRKTLRYC